MIRYRITYRQRKGFLGRSNNMCTMVQMVKNLPAMQEPRVQSLGQEDPLEEGMATHSSILAWKSHGQRSLVGYSLELQKVRHDWVTISTACAKALRQEGVRHVLNTKYQDSEKQGVQKDMESVQGRSKDHRESVVRCPLVDEWIRKLWYIYRMEYYSAMKRNI